MGDSTTWRPWTVALTFAGSSPARHARTTSTGIVTPATPGSIITTPTGTGLVESPI